MANPLTNKLGPLQTWQWLAIGAGGGLLIYLYERNKAPAAEPTNELAGSTNNPFTEGAGTGGGESAQPAPSPGLIGEPGPAGPPGEPSPAPAEGISEARLEAIENSVAGLNNPPTGSHTVSPQTKGAAFPLTNPANGQKYKVVHEKGKTVHVYKNGHKVVVGAKRSKTKAGHTAPANHKKAKRLRAPKPKPPRVVASHPQPNSRAAPPKKPAKKRKR